MRLMYTIGKTIVNAFREIKLDVSGDTQDCKQVTPYGVDGIPINGLIAVSTRSGRNSIIVGYIQKAVDGLNDGDVILYSKDGTGTIVSKVIMRTDGKIDITSNDTININDGNLTIEP